MKIGDLTAEAYGTLRALAALKSVSRYEPKSAAELVRQGYAELRKDELRVTAKGRKIAKEHQPRGKFAEVRRSDWKNGGQH